MFTILHLMKNSDKLLEGQTIEKMDRLDFPFMETKFPGGPLMHEIAARKQGPRILKTHLPLCYWKDALDRSPETKVIQTIHNPKDTLVSFYHFHRMNKLLGCLNGTWDEFFEMVEDDYILEGSLFEHTAEWYQYNQKRDHSLVLVYEEMKKDLKANVKKICNFLGKNLSERAIDLISERATFESQVKDPTSPVKGNAHFKEDRALFLHKGKVGDWQEYFNEKQNVYVDAKSKECFDPIGLKFQFE